ncbi:MAG TPA: PadR family transcriptional regulator [Bryobacteraceae bacterium]|nr:PadR family transcriptional regulator [Bryobacteraceae bacterium]
MGRKRIEKLDLLQGTLDMMVLRTLSAGPANGYEIAKAIERSSEDVLNVDHGSLYPALHRLEKSRLVTGKWQISSTNRRARYYRITPAGRKRLVVERSKWEQLASAVSRVMRPA